MHVGAAIFVIAIIWFLIVYPKFRKFALWGVVVAVIVVPVVLVGAIKAAVFWENWKDSAAQLAQDSRLGCHVDGLDPGISNDGSVFDRAANQLAIPVYSAHDIRQKWMFSVPPCVGADTSGYTDVPPPVRVRADHMDNWNADDAPVRRRQER
jgi:hypothetical protein